jgi:acyl-CoA thioester hydrolase
MESCEVAFYRSLDLPLISFVPGKTIGWPRVDVSCQYFAPLRFNDSVDVRLFVKKLGKRSVTYIFQFRKEGKLMAQGEMSAVCVTSDAKGEMVAQLLPENVVARLQPADETAWTAP